METSTSGKIHLQGELIGTERNGTMAYKEAELSALRARIGMVFQHFKLFPHMTVVENVMEGQVVVLGRSKAEARDKATGSMCRAGRR